MISAHQQKYITSLHLKKYRQKYLNFLVEGEKMVKELLTQERIGVVNIYGTERWATENAALLTPFYHKFKVATAVELKKVGTLTTPNEVLAIAQTPSVLVNDIAIKDHLILYLDGIQDPGNMGTIMRIADWFGIATVCCSPDTVDAFSPKVIQSGMGACFRVNIVEDADLGQITQQEHQLPIMGAVMDGDNLFATSLPSKGVLVIGNEGKGIRPETMQLLTHRITIPGADVAGAESLNAGVATGIIVAEIRREVLTFAPKNG